jgi:putative restriction endonuclease
MLDLLRGFDGKSIELPSRTSWRPDRERLAVRFDRFKTAA